MLALLRSANRASSGVPESNQEVKRWQAERSGQFRTDQASIVTDVQETLAKGLAQSLGAYLRTTFETTPAAVVQMTVRDAMDHMAQGTYLLSFEFLQTPATIQIEESLVFSLIDILLGGGGEGQIASREVTEIEDHVMEGVGKIICHEIATAWGADPRDCNLIGAQGLAQMQRLFSPNDRVVISQFDSKMGEASGYLRVLVPGTTFGVLLRKLASDAGHLKSSTTGSSGYKLGEKLMECSFPVALSVTAIQLPVDQILALASGQVCDLGVPVGQSGTLMIAGRAAFDASPVRQGRKRAAQIGRPRMQSSQERVG